jgi:hypothetical protein
MSSDTKHSFAEVAVLEMTKALNNRLDPDKEAKKMEDENSIASIKAFYIFGEVDWNTGTVLETGDGGARTLSCSFEGFRVQVRQQIPCGKEILRNGNGAHWK